MNLKFSILLITILIAILTMIGCSRTYEMNKGDVEGEVIVKAIDVPQIKNYDIETMNTIKVSRLVMGGNLHLNEIFVKESNREKNLSLIRVVDIETGNIKNEVTLQGGNFDSPTHFYSPSHIEKVGGNFYIVDQRHKVVCFDENFKRQFTMRFTANANARGRSFIDFFQIPDENDSRAKQLYWTRSAQIGYMTHHHWSIGIYRLRDDKTPVLTDTLYTVNFKSNLDAINRKDRKFTRIGTLWPSPYGFFKEGKIYYTSPTENRFYIYHLKKETTTAIELSHLEPRIYTEEEADRFGYFKTDGPRIFRRNKKKLVYVPYSGALYHHGMYDVGKGKIGLAGGLDIEKMKYRMDIIDVNSLEYLHSIWFPVSYGFKSLHSYFSGGAIKTLLDVDRGVYIWQDIEKDGDELTTMVKITRYKTNIRTKNLDSEK
jgi:hypothetical protein